ncbi:hypothetical protein PanWU01x14_051030 [Parasponia andersonii]|uniref:Uncharacterized protein n=1 Tax=Parasponia andersonii TaxID=3476 RepID=A0A2P5DLV6_PARAD|nr:hypothetical protein PanWU01x14_051030 [Parasponia andersonii]
MYSPLQLRRDFPNIVYLKMTNLLCKHTKYQRRKQKVRGVTFTPLEGTLRDTVEELVRKMVSTKLNDKRYYNHLITAYKITL